ncbi:MAG: PAS domain S-box protein [Planctomycetota bacterium]
MTLDYAQLFQKAGDAVFIADSTGHYVEANPAASALTGYTRDELRTMKVGELCVEAERTSVQEHFEQLLRDGRCKHTCTYVRKDGSHLTVECHAVDLGDGLYQGVVRDLSERVAVERALHTRDAAYSTLVDLCHDAVISAGPDIRITSWNPAAARLFGFSAEEAIGMPVTRIVPARYQKKHLAAWRARVKETVAATIGRTLNAEGRRKDGAEFALEATVGMSSCGQVFTAVIRDVGEQRQVLEKLNRALQQLQFHVDRMPLSYIIWDRDFKVLEWNQTAERIFGYTRKEALGKDGRHLLVPPDVVNVVDQIWTELLEGDTSSHSINDNIRKDGGRITCEWFNTPLRDSAGRITGVASMTMDVSERERMESQIRNTQRLESLAVMASGIAHDFNSTLMVIMGNTSLLRSVKGLPPRALEHIELIEDAGSRTNDLIKHILAYARTGRHNPQPTYLNLLLKDALAFLKSSIGKEHDIVFKSPTKIPLMFADHSQIEQVILNLCMNAKQAMPKGGTISITIRRATLTQEQAARCVPHDGKPGPCVEFMVADTGCGMDEATMARIFDPFFSTKADGHGLGLAAVLGILRQHRGAAKVQSKKNKGTKFYIYFPVYKPKEKPDTRTTNVRRSASDNGNRRMPTTAPIRRRRTIN